MRLIVNDNNDILYYYYNINLLVIFIEASGELNF